MADQHGGRREGAGRPLVGSTRTQIVSITLTSAHIAKVERWMEAHDEDSFSAAVRSMIDVADATT